MPALAPQAVRSGAPYVDCIATVVDALRMKDEFESGAALQKEDIGEDDLERLVIEQIEFCNIVLLNKAADVTPEELGKLKGIVKSINPGAKVLECNYGDVDLDEIIFTGMFDFDAVATSAAWIAAIEGEDEEEEAEGEALEYGIDTYVYTRRPALDLNKFDHMVATKWPKNIRRAPGYDKPGPPADAGQRSGVRRPYAEDCVHRPEPVQKSPGTADGQLPGGIEPLKSFTPL